MWMSSVLVLLGAACATCSITCPDGKTCSDLSTCCLTTTGYACCPVPQAVCCADLAHCWPSGYHCDSQRCVKEGQPWASVPLLQKAPAEAPRSAGLSVSSLAQASESDGAPVQSLGLERTTVVHCDNHYVCPDRTTCCRHPTGLWFCCAYSPGRCCLDGYHCCPYGFDCDVTYTRCIRQGLRYPLPEKLTSPSVPATRLLSNPENPVRGQQVPLTALTPATDSKTPQNGVIRCDNKFYCPAGNSCCKLPSGKWGCCQFPLAKCCSDGLHCCQYGYTCDPSSTICRKGYSQIPSGLKDDAKQD